MNQNDVPVLDWFSLYGEGWGKEIHPSAYKHPAKYSRGLIRRIYRHAIEKGYLKPGDVCLDVFGGVGLGGLDAARSGIIWVGMELERNFRILAQRNFILLSEREICACDPNTKSYLHALRKIVREEDISVPREEAAEDIGGVLQQPVQKSLWQGEEAQARGQTKPKGSNALEQGQALVGGDAAKTIGESRQRQPGDGEEWPLEGREDYQRGRLRGDPGEREKETGTRTPYGTGNRPTNSPGRGSSPQKRSQDGQLAGQSGVDDNFGTHAPTPSEGSGHIQEAPSTDLSDMQSGIYGNAELGVLQRGVQEGWAAAILAATRRQAEGAYCQSCQKIIAPIPIIYQGDSRQLAQVLAEAGVVGGLVSSPPFQQSNLTTDREFMAKVERDQRNGSRLQPDIGSYGDSPGQLGAMPEGSPQAILSSPPYSVDALGHRRGKAGDEREATGEYKQGYTGGQPWQEQYGATEGQLGELREGNIQAVLSSPPYADSMNQGSGANDSEARLARKKEAGIDTTKSDRVGGPNSVLNKPQSYGRIDGQLGAMKDEDVAAILSSPPFSPPGNNPTGQGQGVRADYAAGKRTAATPETEYGTTAGQLGAMPMTDVMAVISSPPYANMAMPGGWDSIKQDEDRVARRGVNQEKEYGHTAGQLGSMPMTGLDAIVSSPPFVGVEPTRDDAFRYLDGRPLGSTGDHYGTATGQLGMMPEGEAVAGILSSPPYEGSAAGNQGTNQRKAGDPGFVFDSEPGDRYGDSEGQLGRMPAGIVSSPPYERSMDSREDRDKRAERAGGFTQGMEDTRYGQNPNTFLSKDPSGLNNQERHEIASRNPQVGQLEAETFWAAAAQIVQQCYQVLAPGGYAIWVTKRFVRDKKIVEFSDQWLALCEHAGFVPVERVRAWVIEEAEAGQMDMFGGFHRDRKARLSFFRRLHMKKFPHLAIEYEDVLIVRRPPEGA